MNLITHFLIGWNTAVLAGVEKRDRVLITIAGVLPDIDGLGAIAEWATRNTEKPLRWFSDYHHQLAHNLTAGIIWALAVLLLAKKKASTALAALLAFHIHLLADVLGGRGPEGFQWPIPYLYPFSPASQITWQYQWPLDSWQNLAITVAMLAMVFIVAWKKGLSPLEVFSNKADELFVRTVQKYKRNG
ncbi:MAG: metal-dependent hydrolase [Planctomycetota bacterium]